MICVRYMWNDAGETDELYQVCHNICTLS